MLLKEIIDGRTDGRGTLKDHKSSLRAQVS